MEPIWYPSKIEFFFSISLVTIQYQNWLLCRKKRSKLGRIQIRVVFKGRIRIRFFLGGKIRIRFFFKDRIWIRISLSKVGSGWTLTGSSSKTDHKITFNVIKIALFGKQNNYRKLVGKYISVVIFFIKVREALFFPGYGQEVLSIFL